MTSENPEIKKDNRYYLGLFFFILAMVFPVFGLLIPFLELTPSAKAFALTFTLAGGPEVALIVAAIFWGKETLQYFKRKVFDVLKRFVKSIKPRQYVGKRQYYFWLIIWLGTSIPAFIELYAPGLLFPKNQEHKLYLAFGLDFIFITSFFMLGGQFWDKIGALFKYDAGPNEID